MHSQMKPFILAITDPVSSGKTSVATGLAKEISQCVNIDADHVKHFIANGLMRSKGFSNAPYLRHRSSWRR